MRGEVWTGFIWFRIRNSGRRVEFFLGKYTKELSE
jgi:hypothetical protein